MKNILFNKISILIITTLFVAVCSACEDDDDVVTRPTPETINDLIVLDDDFTILEAALDKAGLLDELDEENGEYTIFAPTDASFIAAGITNLDRFTADELKSVLQYHLLDSGKFYTELEEGPLQTQNGDVYVSFAGNRFFLNGNAEFLQIDFDMTNGVLHVVDEVLFPPAGDVTNIITEESQLSILEAAIEKAGLQDDLANEGPFTIFAPTDAAFEKYLADNELSSIDEISDDDLAEILSYHVMPARTFSVDLEAGDQNTLAEESFRIIFTNNIILADKNPDNDNALIIEANALGTNGIVHNIDRVLLPD